MDFKKAYYDSILWEEVFLVISNLLCQLPVQLISLSKIILNIKCDIKTSGDPSAMFEPNIGLQKMMRCPVTSLTYVSNNLFELDDGLDLDVWDPTTYEIQFSK